MNYQTIYSAICRRGQTRVMAEGAYVEHHHIVPLCMGGSNNHENITMLTPEEHYIAHQLLVKMYPHHKGLAFAAVEMTFGSKKVNRSTNKLYGWLKRKQSTAASEWMKGNKNPIGYRHTAEECQRRSMVMRGNKNALGKHWRRSAESNRKNSEARLKQRDPRLGTHHTDESRMKISASKKGRSWSATRRLAYESSKRKGAT